MDIVAYSLAKNVALSAASGISNVQLKDNELVFNFKDGNSASILIPIPQDGLTPYIGANGNWYLGEEDTGVGAQGEPGPPGGKGEDGASITSIFINENNHLICTLSNNNEIDAGEMPSTGKDGKSAYEIWLDEGNTGTEADFLASLKGEPGTGGSASITIDDTMSDTSTNPVQNKVIKKYIDDKSFTTDIAGGSIDDTPVGFIIPYMGFHPPEHYLDCSGGLHNISDYPELAEHFKTEFGKYNYFGGDGITTFATPNLKGEFLRGYGINGHSNQGNGTDVGRHQDATVIPYMSGNNSQIYFSHGLNLADHTTSGTYKKSSDFNSAGYGGISSYTTRPTNTSVMYCIKCESTLVSTKGEPGNDGKSAYQIWLDNGNSGSEDDFLASLKGEDGTGVSVSYFDEVVEDLISSPVEFSFRNNATNNINLPISLLHDIRDYQKVVVTGNLLSNNLSFLLTKEFYVSDLIDNDGNWLTTYIDINSHIESFNNVANIYINLELKDKSTPTSLHLSKIIISNGPTGTGELYIKGVKECVKETKGTLDDIAPTIGDNGNWYVLDKDTGVKAQGPQGEPGDKGDPGEKGNDGKSITLLTKDENNNIIVTFSDGSVKNIGQLNIDVQADFLTSEGFGNLRYYNNRFQYFDTVTSSWIDASATPDNIIVVNLTPKPVKSISASYNRNIMHFELKWEEPDDTYLDGQLFCTVEKVVIVRKKDSAPETIEDGTKILEVKRKDFYSHITVPYVDETLTPVIGDVWYYKIFPVSTSGMINESEENAVQVIAKNATLYGFKIDQNESDPASMITYIEDNKNFRPVHMDFDTDTFDYGDWADAFFMKVRPCLLKYDGTVAFYLNPDNTQQKEDGSSYDYESFDNGGNVMIEFPKVYWKIVDNGDNTANIYVSDSKIDEGFHCWSHIDANGDEIDYCYMPAFNGVSDGTRLRSIDRDQVPTGLLTAGQEYTLALANNIGNDKIWCTEVLADRQLVNILLLLIGKSTDTQAVFGKGNCNSYLSDSNPGIIRTGNYRYKGLFWGANNETNGVKVFGMEHWWGNVNRRIAGWINNNGNQRIKMTYGQQDGSTTDGYNITGGGYITIPNSAPEGSSGGQISGMIFNENGIFPKVAKGSATTYYTDTLFFYNARSCYALVGGTASYTAARVGAFTASLYDSHDTAPKNFNASISCKPLANKG